MPVPTVFHEPWWLETTGGTQIREASVSADGVVIGRLPYFMSRRKVLRTLLAPPFTHLLGPALAPELTEARLSRSPRRFAVMRDLIAQLPRASYTRFELHPGITDTLAFEAAGFTTSVRFTVEIASAASDALWGAMRDKTRNVIRRARERLTVTEEKDPARFLAFYDRNIAERGLGNYYDRDSGEALIAECVRRGAGRVLMASVTPDEPQAAIFTVWDNRTEYYFMTTRLLQSMNGAVSLLIWVALQEAASHGRTFDMDGVDSARNLLLLTGFGGEFRPRYTVTRGTVAYALARRATQISPVGRRSTGEGGSALRWWREPGTPPADE